MTARRVEADAPPYPRRSDHIVHTEFGADAWTFVAEAGFDRIAVSIRDYPAVTAIMARA